MRLFFYFYLFLIFTGCNVKRPINKFEKLSDVQLVNEIRHKVAKKMKEEYDLIPCGTGSQMMDEIKMIALSFNYYKSVDIEKARELLLAATNEMIKAVNEDCRIHTYLYNYPFTPENVEIRIFAYEEDRSFLPEKSLSIFGMINGKLDYQNFIREKGYRLETILTETYEEAMLKQNKQIY